MHFSTKTVAYAASVFFATSALAAPAKDVATRTTGGRFSVTQQKNPRFQGKNGAIAYAKGFAKYNVAPPSHVAAAASSAASGSATATPQTDDSEYTVPVQIGTPAQTLNLDFDTGSSDLWVFSSETSSKDVDGQTVYDVDSSSTAKKMTGETWSISYGDGSSCSGDVYTDVVAVGGVTVTSQAVESAETVSSEFISDSDTDGLLGLGFKVLNTGSPTQLQTWFGNAASQLESNVFTADLKYEEAGTYNFGYIDDSAYTGDITYTDLTDETYWRFEGSGYAVGDGDFVSTTIKSIADTGTTLLYLPGSIVEAYYNEIDSATDSSLFGGYIFDCDETPPDFVFGVGSYRGTIPGKYLNYAPVITGSSKCFGGIQSSGIVDALAGLNIWGDVLLKSQFVVFDAENNRLGFAAKST